MRIKRVAGVIAIAIMGTCAATANATNLLELTHDAETDALVLKVAYRGSHDNHPFSLEWGECKDYAFGTPHQIGAQLVDRDFDDSGPTEFKQTLKFSIADLKCRPSKLTIRTSTGVYRTILVPEAHEAESSSHEKESESHE
jgi:hypothetical protein